MNTKYLLLILILILCTSITMLSAQIELTSATTPPFNPVSLIEDQFLGDGVEVVNITFDGANSSVGYFSNAANTIGLENGIVLTTGAVESAGADIGIDQTGAVQASVDNASTATDVDLNSLSNTSLFNIAKYEIEFIPASDTISFRYVFASEEYPEFVCSDYNDVFGFFISGPGINGSFSNGAENIASIPGTTLPVTINNVNSGNVGAQGTAANCSGSSGSLNYSQYYVDNDGSNVGPAFDGWLTPFEAKIAVVPCQTYTIKIVIADQGDAQRDSGVFLEGKSFDSDIVDARLSVDNPEGVITEGCNAADLELSIGNPRATDYTINLLYSGNAASTSDFSSLPSSITIPAGQTSQTLTLEALVDAETETQEELKIIVDVNSCLKDTFTIGVQDYQPISLGLRDTSICEGGSVDLVPTLAVTPPTSQLIESVDINKAILSPFPGGSPILVSSELEVTGIQPDILNEQSIQSVCLDISHTRLQDLSIYIVSPGGRRIVLSSGNGEMDDNYTNTCFSPTSTNDIRLGSAPFTGTWQAEESFDNLVVGNSPLNGIWTLEVVDNAAGFSGILNNWDITFNPPYEVGYQWSSDASLSCTDCPNPTASPTTTTTYNLTVMDGSGCDISQDVTVTVAQPDFADAGADQTICAGSTVSLTASGGNMYEWSTNESGASIDVAPTTTTTYTVSVTDAAGCMSTDDVTVNVGNNLSASLDPIDISCNQAGDGSITANSSGTDPIQYAWSNGDNTPTISGLEAGSYSVTITDANNCSTIESTTISEPDAFTISTDQTATCSGQLDGTAIVNVTSGGVAPLSYVWSSNANGQETAMVSGLAGGTYEVTVTDDNGCPAMSAIDVVEEPTLVQPIVSCSQVTADAITFVWPDDPNVTSYEVNVENIAWTSPSTRNSHTLSGLSLGQTINIQVRANGNCPPGIGTASCTTNDCTIINFEVVDKTDLTCFESGLGLVELNATGDNPPFTYTVNSISNNTGLFTDLAVGNYVANVEDALGCTETVSFEITQPAQLTATATIDKIPDCNSGGDISVNVLGGVAPYSYLWSDGSMTSGLTDVAGGTYILTITDGNNCLMTVTENLSTYTNMSASTSITNASCAQADASAEVTVSGGMGQYSYSWNDGQYQTSARATNLAVGQYEVTITDEASCSIVEIVNITAPSIDIELDIRNPTCFGEMGSILLDPLEGVAPFSISIDGTNYHDLLEVNDIPSGNYSVMVTDDIGCTQTFDDVILSSPEAISVGLPDAIELNIGDSIMVNPVINNTSGMVDYSWTTRDSNYLSCTDCRTPYIKPLYSADLNVTITDSNGCTATGITKLVVDRQRKIFAPNAVSANNDGKNELFSIFTKDDGIIESLMIFDSWGNLVFEREDFATNDPCIGWDGRFQGRRADNKVYVYAARIRFEDEVVTHSGSFILVR